MAEADYTPGEMNIGEQRRTFDLFMRMTVWGSALTAVTLVFLTLHFSVGSAWFVALGVAFVLGVVIGLVLKMKSAWYATLVGYGILGGFIGAIIAVVGALTA